MITLVAHLLITAALLLVVANLVSGIEVESWGAAFIAALVLGLVNGFVRPIMVLLTLPITVLTLGLFLLVLNALMFMLAAAVTPGFRVRGFGAALIGSIVLALLNFLIAAVFGPALTGF